MPRKCFYSFHYEPDNWRASQVRNMGVIEGNQPVGDNDWESVKRGGDRAIENWIANQMSGRSCTVLLIGAATAGRKWIKHEIEKTWKDNKGLVGVYIHNLKNVRQQQTFKGKNPFSEYNVQGTALDRIVQSYDPPYTDSAQVYRYINANLSAWVEEAVAIRSRY
jgi:hypothetical protein